MQPISQADIEQYQNPYSQMVTRNVLDEMQRRSDIAGQQTADAAVRAGAYGGSRFGVQEAELAKNLQDIKFPQIDISGQYLNKTFEKSCRKHEF